MKFKHVVPWRIRHPIDQWLEKKLRPATPELYKFLKYGRFNINTSGYWDEVWKNDTLDRSNALLYDIVVQRIPSGATVLDVGCGTGTLARKLRDDCSAVVTCLDFSSWACEQLADQGFATVVSSLPRIPLPDRSFDVAVATEVLEHLDGPQKTMKEMARVVKPGGTVICSVPNSRLLPHEELEHQHGFDTESFRSMVENVSRDYEILTEKVRPDSDHEFLVGIVRIQ